MSLRSLKADLLSSELDKRGHSDYLRKGILQDMICSSFVGLQSKA